MSDWHTMESAPLDGTSIRLKLDTGFELIASWQGGFMNSEGDDCCCWVADEGSEVPDCWTDGACWEVNANEMTSAPPTHWQPIPSSEPRP